MQRDQGWMDEASMLLEPLDLTKAAALPPSYTTKRDTTRLHAVLLHSAQVKKNSQLRANLHKSWRWHRANFHGRSSPYVEYTGLVDRL